MQNYAVELRGKTRLKSSLEKYIFEKHFFFKSNSKFVSSHFQANKTIKKGRPT